MWKPAGSLVPFELTVCGLGELGRYAARGVSHVLSILDPCEGQVAPQRGHDDEILRFASALRADPPPDAPRLRQCFRTTRVMC
jgi:hypothetical protein